jgi:hypothetical protein
LHRLRDERLRALLRTAVTRSPWHRRRLAGVVDPDTATAADLERLPTMTKADVMEHWDAIVTDRGVFVWDFEGWLGFGLSRDRTTLWLAQHAGGGAELRRAFVAAAHATHPTSIVTRTFAGSPQLGVSCSFPVTLPLGEIVAGLNDFGPTHLFAYPSMMHRLAGELRAGRLWISPRELNCGAEPLVADARVQIEAAFERPVINLYAAAEAGVIARSYPGSAGLHLNEDIAVYEPVDDRPAHRRSQGPGRRRVRLRGRHRGRSASVPLGARAPTSGPRVPGPPDAGAALTRPHGSRAWRMVSTIRAASSRRARTSASAPGERSGRVTATIERRTGCGSSTATSRIPGPIVPAATLGTGVSPSPAATSPSRAGQSRTA